MNGWTVCSRTPHDAAGRALSHEKAAWRQMVLSAECHWLRVSILRCHWLSSMTSRMRPVGDGTKLKASQCRMSFVPSYGVCKKHRWCSGIMQDSHSCDSGSIPGRCIRFRGLIFFPCSCLEIQCHFFRLFFCLVYQWSCDVFFSQAVGPD